MLRLFRMQTRLPYFLHPTADEFLIKKKGGGGAIVFLNLLCFGQIIGTQEKEN